MIRSNINENSIQDTISLPSMGKFYNGLLPDGIVTVSSMNTHDEKLLAGSGNIIKKMDLVLSRHVALPTGLKVSDLIVSDKFFLMMIIRALSYGIDYGFKRTCPLCGKSYRHVLNIIKDIPVKYLDNSDAKYQEPFEFILPISKTTITYRQLRGYDEEEVEKYSSQKSAKGEFGDAGLVYSLARRILTINGSKKEIFEVIEFIENMYTKDSTAWKMDRDKYESGIETEFSIICQHCERESEIELPIGKEFFRPRSK